MKIQILWEPSGQDSELEGWLSEQEEPICHVLEELYGEVWPPSANWVTGEMSLQFLGEEEMAELNGQYRGENRPTDVLSFPLWEENGQMAAPLSGELLPLGDLVFCAPVLRDNAQKAGTSPQAELALLLIHGALHLLAWDHDTEEKQAVMWAVQERFQQRVLERTALPKEG